VKFDIGDLEKFVENFVCLFGNFRGKPTYILVLPVTLNCHKSAFYNLNGIKLLSLHPSLCLLVSSWFPLDRFSWNLVLETFMQVCWENPNMVPIRYCFWWHKITI